MAVVITGVEYGSPAASAKIKAGETLVTINSHEIADVLDYRFYMTDTRLVIALLDEQGKERTVKVKKGEYEDLGLHFSTYLMDKQRNCKNKCIFCFVDQMPKGMRETLYFKDDDARMSFLFGNYITLTNLSDVDVEKIIKMRISPINISVHTTDPELRVRMMGNPFAGEKLAILKRLTDAGIQVNTQIVCCPGVNDGQALARSLEDLTSLWPHLQSVSVVPVGLTRYREGLFPLQGFTRETAGKTIDCIEAIAEKMYAQHNDRVAYASDEFYLTADRPLPDYDYYGEFNQLDNGVGIIALLKHEFSLALENEEGRPMNRSVSIATGTAAAPLLRDLSGRAMKQFPGLKVEVHAIANDFFGHAITVAGLLTGKDVLNRLSGKDLGETLLLPAVMLRHEQDCFLDDMTVDALQKELGVPVCLVENDGFALLDALLGIALS